jgi:5'(3')-deoxyribonucleotidase
MKNNNNNTIYFDLDGTLYDLYSQPQWLERITTEQDASAYSADASLYNGMELADIASRLCRAGFAIGVISWCADGATREFNSAVRRVKREWVKKNLPMASEVHIVKYGTPKHYVAYNKNGILVDDNAEVRAAWKGLTIDASQNILPALRGLL